MTHRQPTKAEILKTLEAQVQARRQNKLLSFEPYANIPGAGAENYANELAGLASSIGMPSDSAKSLTEDHFAAIRTTAGMSADELSYWSEREAATFHTVLGENAAQKLAEASKTLSAKSGRKLDLNAITRTNGARVAVNLYFQSMSTKGAK